MYKACVFDLDGTLLNTVESVRYYSNGSLARLGLSPITTEQCKYLCRLQINDFYERLLAYGGCPQEEISLHLADIRDSDIASYEKDPCYLTHPYDGILTLLEELGKRKIRLAVLTNKPISLATQVVDHFFPDVFELCVGQTTETIAKPDPKALLDVCETMGLYKEEILYGGDTDIDMLTAQRAQADCYGVLWGFQDASTLEQYPAVGFASKPQDILDFIDQQSLPSAGSKGE